MTVRLSGADLPLGFEYDRDGASGARRERTRRTRTGVGFGIVARVCAGEADAADDQWRGSRVFEGRDLCCAAMAGTYRPEIEAAWSEGRR